MIETDNKTLENHFINDLGIRHDDIVVAFTGTWGLGRLRNGLDDITNAFRSVLPSGLLLIPTFSYSWGNGSPWNPSKSECPDMGIYANTAWKSKDFIRLDHPSFSFAALQNKSNSSVIKKLFFIDDSTFGENSIFGNIVKLSKERRILILLLGGAFKDCLFRSPFIHYVQEKVGVPYRYHKIFKDPQGSGRTIDQFSRFLSKEEYTFSGGKGSPRFDFPALEDFTQFGEDLLDAGLLTKRPFAYHESRLASVSDSCNFLEDKLSNNIFYCMPTKNGEVSCAKEQQSSAVRTR